MRPIFEEDGGWMYWWVMHPLGCVVVGTSLLASTFQILAFQPPAVKTPAKNNTVLGAASQSQNGGPGGRRSISNNILNDVIRRATWAAGIPDRPSFCNDLSCQDTLDEGSRSGMAMFRRTDLSDARSDDTAMDLRGSNMASSWDDSPSPHTSSPPVAA